MADMVPLVKECSAEHGVNHEDVKNAKSTDHIQEMGSCMMGCIYKKIHVIDDKGLFDVEKSKENYIKYFANESDKKFITDLIHTCEKVNKETVSDGDKGCDRGKLLNECMMPLQKQFFPMR
ncbi:uncharacterized protein LOC121734761 [Aricia agestis]|uniref:uncharacterized protein LOC121734761 n=1 Tax=Aricia agestis TaxID=91739 RepID=UPI001C20200C|nr:uncharacterized protein LOC121734761 [Aricia agestis]